jgi:hypothetical protein
MSIFYKAGYKYQLKRDYIYRLQDSFTRVAREIETDFLWLGEHNILIVKKGYAWDGPSGPTVDTRNFMRGSLVHDALYQLIRLQELDKNVYRILADETLYHICRQDGMSLLRACNIYYSLRVLGNPSARPTGEMPDLCAP